MAIDPRFITAVDLSPYLVDKSTGAALAFGTINFWVDDDRTDPKPVFEIVQGSGNPPNYTYTQLPNPLTLSGVGTIQDAGGNNVALYYYPYDEFGNTQLYYIEVFDSNGLLQFTREAWPGNAGGGGGFGGNVGINNQLTNPQFAQTLFAPSASTTINYTTGTTNIEIAPRWTLSIVATGSSSLTVTQTPVAGSAALPFNPPYTLDIVPGSSITTLQLIQTLNHNPDWAAPQSASASQYLSGSILLGSNTNCVMQYVPSAGNPAQTILSQTNTTGAYAQFSGTIQLEPAANPQTGAVGFDQIVLNLSSTNSSSISNVQVIPLSSNTQGVGYDQTPVNRQFDYMFNYYNPLLQYKPVSSYLVGWDFPLNPAQINTATVAAIASGINTSNYFWDQTIVFQSATSGVSAARGPNGELVLTAAAATQIALIQYLDGDLVNEILNSRLSVNVEAKTNHTAGYNAIVSLWYTKGSALPNVASGSNLALPATLDANGYPATVNQPTGGTWLPVPRGGLNTSTSTPTATNAAQFTIGTSSTTNFNSYGFSQWNLKGIADTGEATFFAIVVGTASIAHNDTISINSISLVPGDIPTRPAAKTMAEGWNACRQYFAVSYQPGTAIATETQINCEYARQFTAASGGNSNLYAQSFMLEYDQTMRTTPTITLYPTNNGNTAGTVTPYINFGTFTAEANITVSTTWSTTNVDGTSIGADRAVFGCIDPKTVQATYADPGVGVEGLILYHYVRDARLGIV